MDPEDAPPRLERVAEIDPAARPYVRRLIRRVHRDGAVQVTDDDLAIECLTSPTVAPGWGLRERSGALATPPVLQSTILQLIRQGASATEAAAALRLDLAAVSAHLRQARRWYGTSSTAQSITRALRVGDIA
jgi:DNA-binding CsgD family transcriptional regulator